VPRGSRVEGQVAGVQPAGDGNPGVVHLTASSVIVDGRETALDADAGPVIAGTARAINLGASDGDNALADADDSGERDDAIAGLHTRSSGLVLRPGTVVGFMLNESVLLR
jgi:glycine cleavage system aminomethyltransferase T